MSLGHDLLAKGTHFFPKLGRWSLTSGGGLRIAAQDCLTLSECEGVHVAAYYFPPKLLRLYCIILALATMMHKARPSDSIAQMAIRGIRRARQT